jgi:transcriptional regulator
MTMYIPGRYKELNPEVVEQFLRDNEFATLVSADGQRLVATHLLVDFEHRADERLVLTGHMARANPHWRTFEGGQEALTIFAGPHTYISPRWYNHTNVPTWNYMAVHVYGVPRVISERAELFALLKRLVDKHEGGAGVDRPYRLEDLPADYADKQMQAIVGFQIEVTRMEASFKLSQNRDHESYDNVVTELYRRTDDNSLAVADEMARRREGLFGVG